MIYQLPNGKVIVITIEEFLDLTDNDIQFLMSVNAGEYSPSPWYGSAIKKVTRVSHKEIDHSIDYTPEDEEKICDDKVDLSGGYVDKIIDVSDEEEEQE